MQSTLAYSMPYMLVENHQKVKNPKGLTIVESGFDKDRDGPETQTLSEWI